MTPEAYSYLLVATVAGGISGVLVMWNRQRAQATGENTMRRVIVLVIGTAASVSALFAFTRVFRDQSGLYAAMVMILITGWAAVLQSVVQLPLPHYLLKGRPSEFALLRNPWTGVRFFGACLRNTPLRHLGGRVFLSNAGRDPRAVVRGLHDAERVHLWALLLSCPWLAVWAMQARWLPIVSGLAVHALLNVYPILHLRYVACRIDRFMAKTRRCQSE